MPALRVAGAIFAAGGVIVLIGAFVRFVMKGVGTPAPVAPTENLVVGACISACASRWTSPSLRPSPARSHPRTPGLLVRAAGCVVVAAFVHS